MSAFFSFLKSKQFFIHLGLALLTLFLVFILVIKWLSSYTKHGQFAQVPDFTGMEITKLDDFIKDKNVSYEIIDSLYDPKQKPGVVIRQDPEATTKVKHNRKVYLYVTGMVAPQIKMPKLIDRSERQARLIIGTYGLRTGSITEKPGSHCNGCVVGQSIKGKEIADGEAVKKGSVIDLTIGVKDSHYSSYNNTDTSKVDDPNFDNDKE